MAFSFLGGLLGALGVGAAAADNKSREKSVAALERQRAESKKYIENAIKSARTDIFKLFPQAQQSRQQGLSTGLQLYQQAYPQMLNTFQQGNVAAQNALALGLPQAINAIQGNPVNLRAIQPATLQQPQGLAFPNIQLASIEQPAGGGDA